jgi:hypothetical protein
MRRIALVLAIAVVSSGATAAAIVLPAGARDSDETRQDEQRGGRPDGPPWLRGAEFRERMEKFESCMREQGFDLGPESDLRITPDSATLNGEAVDREKLLNALRACRPADLPPREEFNPDRQEFGGPGFGGPGFGGPGFAPGGREALDNLRECLEQQREGGQPERQSSGQT